MTVSTADEVKSGVNGTPGPDKKDPQVHATPSRNNSNGSTIIQGQPQDDTDIEADPTVGHTTVLYRDNFMYRWAHRLEQLAGAEARGIERVPEYEREDRKTCLADYMQMGLIWFSANLTANNILLGLLGPLTFELGLTDCLILGTFGSMAGGAACGYISTFGPMSGNRTLVISRYTMGWWPSRVCVLLNIVIMLGYGLIDTLIAGQMLSYVHSHGHGLSIVVGTIIASIISLAICLFGMDLFHIYERYSFAPQMLVLFTLIGVAGPKFDFSSPGSLPDSPWTPTLSAMQLSFFFLAMSGPLAWSAASADFYVYFPPTANRWWVFVSATLGLGLSTAFTVMLGSGIASGVATDPSWKNAYNVSEGALLVEVFAPLGRFGMFCAVVIALGVIANNVPGTYSAALCFQLLGRWLQKVPRIAWTVVGVIIYTICACVGRNELFSVFHNFLALMGYWTAIWITLTLEEEFLFRYHRGYDWSAWNSPNELPIGVAAFISFCIGWVGAILGMFQTYFTGPIGALVGEGMDVGIPLGVSWAGLAFPPLRWLELRYLGR